MKLIGYACRHPDPPLRRAFLPLSDLTVLLGPNDSGKSSLLSAVERDLSGGHFEQADEETAKLIGGVFYAEVSDGELAAIAVNASRTRAEQRSEYGTRSQGQRPPWDDGLWGPPRYEALNPAEPDDWIEHLRGVPGRERILEALKDSRIVGLECAGRNQMRQRVWNAYWCLPALADLEDGLREAVNASDLPFIARRRERRPPYRVGFYIALHGDAKHLYVESAPLPVVAFGPYVDLPMPIGLAVPTDFTVLRGAVDHGITKLVDVVRHYQRDISLDGDPLPPDERRARESPRGWVEREDENVHISQAAFAAAGFLSAAATGLLPDFVSRRYELEIQLRELDAWLQDAPFDIRLRSRSDEVAAPDFPVERAADGHRLWVQLALLDALEQASTVESVIWQRASEAYEAQRELANIDPRDVALERYQADLEPHNKRLEEVLDAFCFTDYANGLPGGDLGEALARAPNDEWVRGGARDRRFFLVDEPERHLHPQLQRAAASWLARTTSERQAPCLLATHSAPFLGLSSTSASYVLVTRVGEEVNLQAIDLTDLERLDAIAVTMGFDRGELLTLVNVWLVVEGLGDKIVLDTLFANELRAAGIEVVPMHGAAKWQAVVESDALWRFTTAEVAVMFDKVSAEKITEMQLMSIEDLEGLPRARNEPEEIKTLALLVAAVRRRGRTITPVANPLPDMLNHLDEPALKAVFPEYPGHEAAEQEWQRRKSGSRDKFLRDRYKIQKSVEAFERVAGAMAEQGIKPAGLVEVIERCAGLALDLPND